MKPIFRQKQLLVMIYLCFTALGMMAQEDKPTSKFTIGIEAGFPFIIDCEGCESAQNYGLRASYRIKRWLELTTNLHNINYIAIDHAPLKEPAINSFLKYSAYSKHIERHLTFNLGLRTMFRLGQGDLFFERAWGLGLGWGKGEEVIPLQGKKYYDKPLTPYVATYGAIGYSFWPTEKLSFTINLGAISPSILYLIALARDNNRSLSDAEIATTFNGVYSLSLGTSYRF